MTPPPDRKPQRSEKTQTEKAQSELAAPVALVLAAAMVETKVSDLHKLATKASYLFPAAAKSRTVEKIEQALEQLKAAGDIKMGETGWLMDPVKGHTLCLQAARLGKLQKLASLIKELAPLLAVIPLWTTSLKNDVYARVARDLRLTLYSGAFDSAMDDTLNLHRLLPNSQAQLEAMRMVYLSPRDPSWLMSLPDPLLLYVLRFFFNRLHIMLEPFPEGPLLLQSLLADTTRGQKSEFFALAAEHSLFLGEPGAALVSASQAGEDREELTGTAQFFQGQYSQAAETLEQALKDLRRRSRKHSSRLRPLGEVAYVFSLYALGTAAHEQRLEEYLAIAVRGSADQLHDRLGVEALQYATELLAPDEAIFVRHPGDGPWLVPNLLRASVLSELIYSAVALCNSLKVSNQELKRLSKVRELAAKRGLFWLEAQLGGIQGLLTQDLALQKRSSHFLKEKSCHLLLDLLRPHEPWRRVLKNLAKLNRAPKPAAEPEIRFLWQICYSSEKLSITLREQSPSQRGGWTPGRQVSLLRIRQAHESGQILPPHDLAAMEHICLAKRDQYGYSAEEITVDFPKLLRVLARHPNTFWEDSPNIPFELVEQQPQLLVTRSEHELQLQMLPWAQDSEVMLVREGGGRLRMTCFSPAQLKMAALLGRKGIKLPLQAADQIKDVLERVSPLVTINAAPLNSTELEPRPASSCPVMRLVPREGLLDLELVVRPLGPEGPFFTPGEGNRYIPGVVNDEPTLYFRNLEEERTRARAIVMACPPLAEADMVGPWNLETLEECLEILQTLGNLGDAVQLEWPRGGAMRVSRNRGMENLSLHIQHHHNWFEATGELALEDGTFLEMQTLLKLMEGSSSRFIRLEDGQFLALTAEFRRRLDALRGTTQRGGGPLRIHPLSADTLEELLEGAAHLDCDQHWKAQLQRIRTAHAIQPKVPETFLASLRPYQQEGFEWMSRLATWGAGACLADDMGLGKTIQALALLVARASGGPALVLAPTSVCLNWIDEARKFAPTLQPILLGPGDRQRCVADLRPGSLLVCSYGLLLQELELLTPVAWNTVILDEAQAVKNVAARRSQAVLQLKAEFRLITTGTPIENHLGELWNLFRFLNPGLLGSLEHFNERFVAPIEKKQSELAREQLRRMIKPFILRRKKMEVLSELPSRTEMLIHVEPSVQEQALYESIRRQAVESLSQASLPPGQRRVRILAEIMRLRRAACNARLILPDQDIPSSKLAELESILQELHENNHKVLIFSQFVDHLTLIQQRIEQLGLPFQYLDGATPLAERRRRIKAFQSGQGEVFLISLRAGGVGINLTAANFVIHMDPWWNPAVEDQASDRAHRLGQQKPVTIYRLVARGSIEDKIVALHEQKRSLADSLLEGTDTSGKLSDEALLALIQDA